MQGYTYFSYFYNIDCGYTLEPPRLGGSNEYPQSIFDQEEEEYQRFSGENFIFYNLSVEQTKLRLRIDVKPEMLRSCVLLDRPELAISKGYEIYLMLNTEKHLLLFFPRILLPFKRHRIITVG